MATVNALQLPPSSTSNPSYDLTPKPLAKVPEKADDSVHLSVAAQSKTALKRVASPSAEIADNLGTSAQTVDQYLGITSESASSTVLLVQAASD
jgi:hypothetical protein